MDVTCDRCSTEYEFEEALVSPRGTTVKCTQCGHLFKVYRSESPLPLPGTHWTVRCADGTSHELATLADLTQLISEGKLSRDDELSRTGKAWRRLGDVEELEEFFQEADRRGPSREALEGADDRTVPLPTLGANEDAPDSVQPPAADDEDDEALTQQRPLPTRAGDMPPSAAPIEVGRGSNPKLPRALSRPPMAAARKAPGPVAYPDLDDDGAELARRRKLSWPWLGAGLAAAAIAGFVIASATTRSVPPANAVNRPAPPAPQQDASADWIARADDAHASHRTERFEQAITDYLQARALHENDPHILSSISRVYAVWSQEIAFALDATKNKPDADPRRAERQKQADDLAEQAKNYAETAARKNPGNVEAEVALTDALRLTRNRAAARAELDRARASDPHPNAEALRVTALLAIAEADGDMKVGMPFASQAVSRDPEMLRARLLYARCLIANGDVQGARYQLHEVEDRDHDHPAVAAIEQLLKDRAAEASAAAAADDAPAKPAASADASPTPVENLNYDASIARGQNALESGQVQLAKRLFEQALFLHPNSPQAHTGLGYVALEKSRPVLAMEHFNAAARAGNDEALIGLADAYRRLGRTRDAVRAYQNYVNRSPNGRQVSIARAQLDRLSDDNGPARRASP
jgi:predicted Zn finger-like uncharacterized protein